MERWATCPVCQRPVRLTDAELQHKRGFCARCDARFDIKAGTLRAAPLPFRDADTAELVPVLPGPPTPAIDEHAGGAEAAIAIRGNAAPGWMTGTDGIQFVAIVMAAIAGVIFITHGAKLSDYVYPGLVSISALVLSQRWARNRFGRDVVALRGGTLHVRPNFLASGGSQVPVADIQDIQVEEDAANARVADAKITSTAGRWRLRIDTVHRKHILVGAGLGHDLETMMWVRKWLEDAMRRTTARLGEP